MASLSLTALLRLFPKGLAWRPRGVFQQLTEAMAESLERVREFLRAAQDEAIPGTATETIEDWFRALNIDYDPEQSTLQQTRGRISSAYTSTGGAALDYLNEQIQKEYADVSIINEAIGGFAYTVKGSVPISRDYARLQGIIDRIAPLHLVPTYDIRIIELLDTAYTGISITGKAITGRTA